jgi:threonine aldolase
MLIGNTHPIRLVTHLDIGQQDVDAFVDAVAAFLSKAGAPRSVAA